MIARLRRQLRLIRYYSASREETPWTRAADWTLIGSLALALPAVFACNTFVSRAIIVDEHKGMFIRQTDDTRAELLDGEAPLGGWPTASFGRFDVTIIEVARGWPLITSTRIRPARLNYDMFHEVDARQDTGDEADAHLREAVRAVLQRRGHADAVESLGKSNDAVSWMPPLRWLASTGSWWVFLYALGMVALATARLGAFVYERMKKSRVDHWRKRGLCANCGYDLRGTEFSERCPECGEIAE